MKKSLFNIVVLLLFSASIIIGCASTKDQKAQSLSTDKTKHTTEAYGTWEDIDKKLERLNSLFKKELISEKEYYETRRKLLDSF
jgi:hypothetical protein